MKGQKDNKTNVSGNKRRRKDRFLRLGVLPVHLIIVKPELSGVINDPNGAGDDSRRNTASDAGNQPVQLGIKPRTSDIHDLRGGLTFHSNAKRNNNNIFHITVCTFPFERQYFLSHPYGAALQMYFFNNGNKLFVLYSLLSSVVLIITWPNFHTDVFNNLMEEGWGNHIYWI